MSQFGDCIRSAQKQGVLTEEEADALIARYDEHLAALGVPPARDLEQPSYDAANRMRQTEEKSYDAANRLRQAEERGWRGEEGAAPDPDSAMNQAKATLAAELEEVAARKRTMAENSARVRDQLGEHLTGYRNLDGKADVFEAAVNLLENQGGGTSSVKNLGDAVARMAHAEMADLLSEFRRSRLTGGRFNKPQMENVVRETLGGATGNAEAKGMAGAVERTFERLRQMFNEAAGFEAIGKLDRYLPQYHNPHALLRAKFPAWRDFILPRLDLDRMRDPITGGRLTPERLDAALKVSWERIVTGGWSDREPSAVPFGLGALAGQRSEHRFLHFKTADDWLAYDREFGAGDPTKAIFNHIRGMAQDIAAMKVLGPNPNATMEWLKQVVQSEAAKSLTGEATLFRGTADADTGKARAARLQAIYNTVRGQEVLSSRVAQGFGDVSNVLTSAYLGSTSILAAATDPFIDRAARYFNGLPATRALWGIVHAMRGSQTREQAVRSGLGLDDFLHVLGNEARYSGTMGGSEWSRWLADRTVNLGGLEAITQSRKSRFGLDFQATVADYAAQGWADLGRENAYLRRSLERYGFAEKDWNALRKTALHHPDTGSAGYLQPVDVKNRDLGLRYLEMILGETERAVPTGTARSRSVVTQNLQRGTVWGEIANSGLQFKSFALSFTTLQWGALKQELHQGPAQGAAYAAALFIPLTLGGAMAIQINNVVGGKDMQPMDPSTGQGLKFWLQALLKGGGLGLAGDFLFDDLTRFGHSPAEHLAGPTISLVSDALKLTVGNAQKLITGKETHFGREAVRTLGRNVPIVSSLPYTRAAYQRMVLDQLQYLTDPEAHKNWRESERKLLRETGQGTYWPRGEMAPQRMPEWPDARK